MEEEAFNSLRTVSTPAIAGKITPADSPAIFTPSVSGRGLGRGRGDRKRGVDSRDRTDARPGSPKQQVSPRSDVRDSHVQARLR
jgi:hypothetical protein